MKNIKLTIAYDGTHYFGWQKTGTGKSIEEKLQHALEKICQHPIQLQAASRTDSGVHAQGQIANFFSDRPLEMNRLKFSLNQLLPADISILNAEEAPLAFHPTIDSIGKEYHYTLSIGPIQLPQNRLYAWHVYAPLNLAAMHEAGQILSGSKDFSAFCNRGSDTLYPDHIREIQAIEIISEDEHRLLIKIRGNRFLYKMARNLTGTIVDVGRGKISLSALNSIILSRDRSLSGMSAPAWGLSLFKIFYN